LKGVVYLSLLSYDSLLTPLTITQIMLKKFNFNTSFKIAIYAFLIAFLLGNCGTSHNLKINDRGVVIFTTQTCPYCIAAKKLLKEKQKKFNFPYEEINVEGKDWLKQALLKRTDGIKTVPKIFIKGKYIGGFSALKDLDQKGKLDTELKSYSLR